VEPPDRPDVVASARAGEEWAVAVLFRREQPRLLRYLAARVPGSADDVASQVWLEAMSGIHRFSGDDTDFRRWLFVIARRRAANERRRRGRDRAQPVAPEGLHDLPGGDDPADTVGERLAGDEAARRIVELLPEMQADVVLLRVVAGLDVAEVARLVGRKPGAVRVLQHRALRRLAKELGGEVTPSGVAGMEESR
jgi:RNA polymerase sigma-70 factor (ECF subfamily)